jgi:tetratricopeptide (TPR) repeat protein
VLALREALAAEPGADAEEQAEAARSVMALGGAQLVVGQTAEAEASLRSAHERLAKLAEAQPGADAYRADLASVSEGLEGLLVLTGRIAEALTWLDRSRDQRRALAAARPSDAGRQLELARSHRLLSDWFSLSVGRRAEAAQSASHAVAILERLVAVDPGNTKAQIELGRSQLDLGNKMFGLGQTAAALESIGQARVNASQLVEANPAVASFLEVQAAVDFRAGSILHDAGRDPEAVEPYRRALEVERRLVRDHPSVYSHRNWISAIYNGLAQSLADTGRPAEGLEAARQGVAVARELVARNPEILQSRVHVCVALAAVGRAEARLGRRTEAAATLREAIAAFEAIPEGVSSPAYLGGALAYTRSLLSGVLAGSDPAGDAAARAEADRAMATLRNAVAQGFRPLLSLRTDHDLDPLRPRPDFQLLLLDMAFPQEPFAP